MRTRRETAVAIAILVLCLLLAATQPRFFHPENLVDVLLANVPVCIIALGMTLVILTGHIDISVGSGFAVCSVLAGLLAKAGLPAPLAALGTIVVGALFGAANGALVSYVRIPSIVVTLATMVALRDALRWWTQGAWIQDLPAGFQWFGLAQSGFTAASFAVAASLALLTGWTLHNVAAGRTLYASGSDADAARLSGINVPAVHLWAFIALGAMTGCAAVLNGARFNQIPSNAGIGLEMKVIAAVVVGGTAITGGKGTILGTVLGVVLLGMIGPALTFMGISAYWERALQGGIILLAVAADSIRHLARRKQHAIA